MCSSDLLEADQELNLIPTNDDESLTIKVIQEICGQYNVLNKLSHDISKKLFSNDSSPYVFIANTYQNIECQNMNSINDFYYHACCSNIHHGKIGNPRKNLFLHGHGIYNLFYNSIQRTRLSTEYKNLYFDKERFIKDELLLENRNVYRDWIDTEEQLNLDDSEDNYRTIISNMNTNLDSKIAEVLKELEDVNLIFDSYLEKVSMSVSDFFKIFPMDTQREILKLKRQKLDEQIRELQCVRKTINTKLTFNLSLEMDVHEDDDIENIIKELTKEQIERNLKFKSAFGSSFGTNDKYGIKVKDTSIKNVEVS